MALALENEAPKPPTVIVTKQRRAAGRKILQSSDGHPFKCLKRTVDVDAENPVGALALIEDHYLTWRNVIASKWHGSLTGLISASCAYRASKSFLRRLASSVAWPSIGPDIKSREVGSRFLFVL
jgi:hypothetical protein